MEINDKIYFTNLTKYKSKINKNITYPEIISEIDYISAKIRTTAKDALSELISVNIARKEISNILDDIKYLKKEGTKNVTLG